MAKRSARPRDPNQVAKLIVDLATGEAGEPPVESVSPANEARRGGGLKGGKARKRARLGLMKLECLSRAVEPSNKIIQDVTAYQSDRVSIADYPGRREGEPPEAKVRHVDRPLLGIAMRADRWHGFDLLQLQSLSSRFRNL